MDFYQHTNNSQVLAKSLENRNVIMGGKQWLKSLKTVIHQNFRKIRVRNTEQNNEVQNLLSKRGNISHGLNDEEIAEKICEQNKCIIIEQIGEMSDPTGNIN